MSNNEDKWINIAAGIVLVLLVLFAIIGVTAVASGRFL